MAQVVVLQFPGLNCEPETQRICESVGLTAEVRRWNDAADAIKNSGAVIIPGGFSYQDRIRAGVVAAKEPVLDAVAEACEAGKPVLGICNGAQILVESGIVPGFEPGNIEVALATNRMGEHRTGYLCKWVNITRGPADNVFTEFMTGDDATLPIPLAHAEGRFTTSNPTIRARLEAGESVALRYATIEGLPAANYPDNPNGSDFAIAALGNPGGNALAIMPHPERGAWMHQLPRVARGEWGQRRNDLVEQDLRAHAPCMGFFIALKRALA